MSLAKILSPKKQKIVPNLVMSNVERIEELEEKIIFYSLQPVEELVKVHKEANEVYGKYIERIGLNKIKEFYRFQSKLGEALFVA